jgi:hypothetical protein
MDRDQRDPGGQQADQQPVRRSIATPHHASADQQIGQGVDAGLVVGEPALGEHRAGVLVGDPHIVVVGRPSRSR